MFSVAFVCVPGSLFVSKIASKSQERITMNFYGGVQGVKRTGIKFGGDQDYDLAMAEFCAPFTIHKSCSMSWLRCW